MPTVRYNPGEELLKNMLQDDSVEEVVIDEALAAISEGDKKGALSLLEIVAKARSLRAERARAGSRRPAKARSPRRELVEA